MREFYNSVMTSRPIEEVFSFFTDTDKLTKAIKNAVKFEKVTEGPFTSGTKLKHTFRTNDGEDYSIIEITEFSENERITMKNVRGNVKAFYTYRFKSENGGTEIELTARFAFEGYDDTTADMIFEAIKGHDYDQLEDFKEVIEKG